LRRAKIIYIFNYPSYMWHLRLSRGWVQRLHYSRMWHHVVW
jgi:hypothetical protein